MLPENEPVRQHSGWSLVEYQLGCQQAISNGEALKAHDIATEGLRLWPGDTVLRRSLALALARIGSTEDAIAIAASLSPDAQTDEESLGLLGTIYKDRWTQTGNARDLQKAFDAYKQAFDASEDRFWAGINSATTAFLLGAHQESTLLAQKVLTACGKKISAVSENESYWLAATIAEANLLLNNVTDAEHWYAQAAANGKDRLGDILSTWRNARLILTRMRAPISSRIAAALSVPRIAVFAGHRIDEPGRTTPRFPEERAETVKSRIRAHLLNEGVRFGYSSAASGSDILFIEALQEIGGRTHIILPCNKTEFLQQSVASAGNSWVDRFEAVIQRADEVIVASPERLTIGSVAYDFANQFLYGLARLRSRQTGTDLVHIAVWNGLEGDGKGGTADTVRLWQEWTKDLTIVRPSEGHKSLESTASPEVDHSSERHDQSSDSAGVRSEIRALLFADVNQFSRLTEREVVVFIEQFLSPIANLIQQTDPAPLLQNTWGDGLFMVFDGVRDAGKFALKLLDLVAAIDRDRTGLPRDLSFRVALHAGPVYTFRDRIISKTNYIGSHVNRAARIEPVTPAGQIYVTDAFGALAELYAPHEFRFSYVGRTSLAKNYGETALYSMHAKDSG